MPSILILSTRFPYPLMGGDRIRIYNVCKTLAKQYDVELLVIGEETVSKADVEAIVSLGIKVKQFTYPALRFKLNAMRGLYSKLPIQVEYYKYREIQDWVNKNFSNYDLIFCNHIRSTEYVKHLNVKKIVDLHDAISLNYSRAKQYASGLWKWIYSIENKKVLPYEVEMVNTFDRTLLISEVDKSFLVSHGADEKRITLFPVGVPVSHFQQKANLQEKNWIVFLGKMNTVANSDAAVYFATQIFPEIRKNNPQLQIEFIIVGADPSKQVQQLSHINGVTVTGKVQDHLPYIQQAKVVIDPMRFGAGMQNKVLEAMALGKAVIASPLAVEGIDGVENQHYLVAKSPGDYIEMIPLLFNDESYRMKIGNSARELILQHYSWSTLQNSLLQIVDEVLHQ